MLLRFTHAALLVFAIAYLFLAPLPPRAWAELAALVGRPRLDFAAPFAATVAVLTLGRYLFLWLALRRRGATLKWATFATILTAGLTLGFRIDEPTIGLLWLAALLWLTARERPNWADCLGAVLLFAAWSNTRDGLGVGLSWVAIWVVGTPSKRSLTFFGCVLLGACCNPSGPQLGLQLLADLKNPNLVASRSWQPLDFSSFDARPWLLFASFAAVLAIQLKSRRTLSQSKLALVLVIAAWALVQQRGLAYWLMALPYFLFEFLGKSDGQNRPGARKWDRMLVGFGLLTAIFATSIARSSRPIGEVVSTDTPWRIARELLERNGSTELRAALSNYPERAFTGTILCGERPGDFLATVLDPAIPVLVHSRPMKEDRERWADARRALLGEADWWDVLDRLRVNLVVIDPGVHPKLADRLRASKAWALVQDDGPGGVFATVRREPRLP